MVTKSLQVPVHVSLPPLRQTRRSSLIVVVHVPVSPLLPVQLQLQSPPTPAPCPPAMRATATVPFGRFVNLKPRFRRTLFPTSSTPSTPLGKVFTRALPSFTASVLGGKP